MKIEPIPFLVFVATPLIFAGCKGPIGEADESTDIEYFDGSPEPVDPDCTSVRLTAYEANESGWCEFNTGHGFLPEFVRSGMHLAIAEPWNGGSFEGESGEACGECWEVDTIDGTGTVMVTNLCPIEGNPLCSGGHFHFDLSTEAAKALGGGGLDEAAAKRIPCPTGGNVHVQVNDSNKWGYLRIAFLNHAIPIREFSVRGNSSGDWVAAERSGGAWHVLEGPTAKDGDGIVFQLESALGEVVESTSPLPHMLSDGATHDLGIQFQKLYDDGSECVFTPPRNVFVDEWGGIEGVRWQPNPWGASTITETDMNCRNESSSCLLLENMAQWDGAHFYYRQQFPVLTFKGASIHMKATEGAGEISVAPSYGGKRCDEKTATVTADSWVEVSFDLNSDCGALEFINAITISNLSETFVFIVDDIRFF